MTLSVMNGRIVNAICLKEGIYGQLYWKVDRLRHGLIQCNHSTLQTLCEAYAGMAKKDEIQGRYFHIQLENNYLYTSINMLL